MYRDTNPHYVHNIGPRWTQGALVEFALRYGRQRPDADVAETMTAFIRYWNAVMVPGPEHVAQDARMMRDHERAMRRLR